MFGHMTCHMMFAAIRKEIKGNQRAIGANNQEICDTEVIHISKRLVYTMLLSSDLFGDLNELSTDGRISVIEKIRLSIIGDEDEKTSFLESPNLCKLFQVMEAVPVIETPEDDLIMEHSLTILYSLSNLSNSINILLNRFNLLNKLIQISINNPENNNNLTIIFKILSNILSLKNDINIDLVNESNYRFKLLIYSKINAITSNDRGLRYINNNNKLLLNLFNLVPHLNPSDLTILINPILRLLELLFNNPKNFLMKKYSGKPLFEQCLENVLVPNTPPLNLFSNLTAPLLYSLSHLLYYDNDLLQYTHQERELIYDDSVELKINETISKELYFTITCLLKASDYELKLSSISIIVNFAMNSKKISLSLNKNKTVEKVLPYVIQLIEFNRYKSNKKSVDHASGDTDANSADVGLKDLIVFKSELNLPRKFNPFYILSKLCLNFEFVNDYLLNCNVIIKNFCEIIKNFGIQYSNISKMNHISNMKLNNLSDLFLILSSITANSESNRNLIVKYELSTSIEKILEFHVSNLTKYLQNESDEEKLLVSNHLTISTCYLLRSLSRSVSVLRTYLYETNIIDNLLNVLKIKEDEYLSNFLILNSEILLKTVILSIISNLVLDFSPLRNDLFNNNLTEIVSNLLLTTKFNSIKINCLWVIRHIIYNETPVNRDKSIDKIGIRGILTFCNDEDLSIQEQAFNVLRNLTCSSKLHINKLLKEFDDSDDDFFAYVLHRLNEYSSFEQCYLGIIENLIFVLVHIAAINESKRQLIIKNEDLLKRIREILTESGNNDIKLGCIWLIINLTWIDRLREETSRSGNLFEDQEKSDEDLMNADDDDAENNNGGGVVYSLRSNGDSSVIDAAKRAKVLNDLGFNGVLKELMDTDSMDLRERIRTAISNLNQFA